jgi:fatty-acyl-CoA synthase
MNISDWVKKWALLAPDKIALVDGDQPLTYVQLNRRINRLSHFLQAKGVRPGDRVAVLLRNCGQFLEILFAVSRIGAVFVPLNFRLAGPEIRYVLDDCTPDTFFFGESFVDAVERLREDPSLRGKCFVCVGRKVPSWSESYEAALRRGSDGDPPGPGETDGEAPHILMYTSGTTGLPKGAVLSHRKTFFNVLNATIYYQITAQDRMVVSRPMFHSGGLLVDTLPFLYKGATVILKRRYEPEELIETIQRYGANVVEASATMYRFILEACDPSRYDLSLVRCFYTGGEQVPLSLLRAYAEKDIVLSQIFGQTETSTVTWLPVEHAVRKMGSVGIPVFHGEVRIVDPDEREVPPGVNGEIVVSGPILMSGYWGKPELTAETVRNGWLHTGDLGVRDEEGFYSIVDRVRNVFVSGGENVYPAEVERVLLENPKIAAAAVIGVPDERWGESGKALLVCKGGETSVREEIRAWCAERLAGYKIPKHVEWVDRIPENAAGKIMRYALKGAGHTAQGTGQAPRSGESSDEKGGST